MTPGDSVLLVSHGTVTDLSSLPEFVLRIRRGRPAPPELVEELRRRYEQIGGSPHWALTQEQARGLEAELELPVAPAMRLWNPDVLDVLDSLASTGTSRVCLLPMAPYSVPVYERAAKDSWDALRQRNGTAPEFRCVKPWGSHPALISAHASCIARTLSSLPPGGPKPTVILTAHSLPQRVIDAGDPYAAEFARSARLVSERLPYPHRVAFQSQGDDAAESGVPWLGPPLEEVLTDVAKGGGRSVVVAPMGFLTEHVETLYDLDIAARRIAEGLGLSFHRVPALDAAPELIRGLAELVREALKG